MAAVPVAEQFAIAQGCTRASSNVDPGAIEFYRKAGYRELGSATGNDSVSMEKAFAGGLSGMQRVLVIGSAGAGKSVFSRELGARLGIPVVHLDLHYWKPGWSEPAPQDWRSKLDELLRAPTWIIDGNYGGSLETRLEAADAVIMLDIPRTTCLWRLLRRRLSKAPRPDVPRGCPERLPASFVRWVWSYPKKHRPRVLGLLEAARAKKSVHVLHSKEEIERLLEASSRGE